MRWFRSSMAPIVALSLSAWAALMPTAAPGDILVVNNNSSPGPYSTVVQYTNSGVLVNAHLVSGLSFPTGIAVLGSDLFVTNQATGTIGEYTTSGATVNANLISGLGTALTNWGGIAVSGANLFVVDDDHMRIGEYTTSGAMVNANLISLNDNTISGIAVSGSDLFLTDDASGTIGEYTTSGGTINADLVTGLNGPNGIAVSGTDLFVPLGGGGIGEYTTAGATVNARLVPPSGIINQYAMAVSGTNLFVASSNGIAEYSTSGAAVNTSLVTSGLTYPYGIAVTDAVPEPGSLALLAAGGMGLAAYTWRRHRKAARTEKPAFNQQNDPPILSFLSHSSTAHQSRRAA